MHESKDLEMVGLQREGEGEGFWVRKKEMEKTRVEMEEE